MAVEIRKREQERLLRLKQVLERVPVSKSTWWAGCATGRFPQPIQLGPRVTCWRESDINALMEKGE